MSESTIIKLENELLQLVTFGIGEEEFGIDILKVQEIIRTMAITKVPNSPSYVEGVINLRGKVIPVIDLRSRFNMDINAMNKKFLCGDLAVINAPNAILELFLFFLQETLPVCITFVYAGANHFLGTAKTNKFSYLKKSYIPGSCSASQIP